MAKRKAATVTELAELHGLVASYYSDMLKQAMQEGINISSGDMGNILRLLQASDITATRDDTKTNQLRKDFGENTIAAQRKSMDDNRKALLRRVQEDDEQELLDVI